MDQSDLRFAKSLHNTLKNHCDNVTPDASIYFAGAMRYLIEEITELSGISARNNKRSRILPRDVDNAMLNDEELSKMWPEGGILKFVFPSPKKSISRRS